MNLLENIQVQGGNNNANTSRNNANNIFGGAANFAGILTYSSSITDVGTFSCKCSNPSYDSYIIDSGASNHMTFNKNLLTNIRLLPHPFLVNLPNGFNFV